MFREYIRFVCEENCGHQVVAETDSGAEGIRLARLLQPDALVLDLTLSGMSGLAVASEIRESQPRLPVLVVSASVGSYVVYRLDGLGVRGFIDKNNETSARLGEALELIGLGRTYFSESYLAVRLRLRTDPCSFAKVLSPRECAVLSLIGRGRDDHEIGNALEITATTAQTHRANILRKLSIRGTPKLIAFALEHGFVCFALGCSLWLLHR